MLKLKLISKSRDANHIQNIVKEILRIGKLKKVKVSNPVHLPNTILRVVTRKSPCGEGSGTINHYYKIIRTKLLFLENPSILSFIDPVYLDQNLKIKIV